MNRSGFSLVELLVATLIASLLGSLLFSALYQVNRGVPVIDTRTDVYEKAAIVNAQLERDLSGVTATNEYYVRQLSLRQEAWAGKKKAEEKSEQDKSKTEKEKAAKEKAEALEEKSEEKPKKPLEKIFYGTNKEGAFDQLTFITTNPLQVYWSGKAGQAKPRVARVMYKLVEEAPSKTGKKSYRLIRQESSNLELDSFNKETAPEQVLADGIKSLTVEYTAIIPEQEKKEAQKETAEKTEKKKKKEIKKVADWLGKKPEEGAVGASEAAETDKGKLPVVPQIVEFNIAFWDQQKKRAIPFSFKTMVRSEIQEKRQDGSSRLLELTKDLMGQAFGKDNSTQKIAQQSPPFSFKGQMRR